MQQQGASQLEAARLQFMEQQCMLSELRGLLFELQADKHSDQGQQEGTGVSQGVDAPSAAAVASLSKHLQAASLAQQLALPDTAAQHNPFSTLHEPKDSSCSSSDTNNPRSELLGTQGHIAGVTPQQIRQLFIPSRKAAQRSHAPVLPLLEKRIKHQIQAAVDAIAGPCEDDHTDSTPALEKIQDMQAAEAQLKQGSMQQLQQLHTEATDYLQELDDIHAVLQQLVGNCMLLEQPKIAQARRERLRMALDNANSKLKFMHQVLYKDTYDASTIQALKVIRQEQQQLEQELSTTIEQAEAELQEYEQLGVDFDQVVQEYAKLQAKVQQVDTVMATLTQLEEDNTDGPMYY